MTNNSLPLVHYWRSSTTSTWCGMKWRQLGSVVYVFAWSRVTCPDCLRLKPSDERPLP